MARMPAGLAFTSFADQMARYSKTPHLRVIETMIIIPTRRPMVLKSIPSIACSWVRMPRAIINSAPKRATMERLTFSLITAA